jgi:hypothetical protein
MVENPVLSLSDGHIVAFGALRDAKKSGFQLKTGFLIY